MRFRRICASCGPAAGGPDSGDRAFCIVRRRGAGACPPLRRIRPRRRPAAPSRRRAGALGSAAVLGVESAALGVLARARAALCRTRARNRGSAPRMRPLGVLSGSRPARRGCGVGDGPLTPGLSVEAWRAAVPFSNVVLARLARLVFRRWQKNAWQNDQLSSMSSGDSRLNRVWLAQICRNCAKFPVCVLS